jgi:hypothetical protein
VQPVPLVAEIRQGGANPFPARASSSPAVVAQGTDDPLGPVVGLLEQGPEARKLGVAPGRALTPDGVTAPLEGIDMKLGSECRCKFNEVVLGV